MSTSEISLSPESFDQLRAENESLRAQLEALTIETHDLQLLYEATIEHGEAVEDQLAEKNLELEKTQRRLDGELKQAAAYILSILPPPRPHDPRAEWLLQPSSELGGDSLGYHDLDDDRLAIYLIDVCGHGVGAALLSVAVMNVFRSASLGTADFGSPAQVLSALNTAFPMERQNDMYFTAWYGVYHRSARRLVYASAGHPPALHVASARRAAADWTPVWTEGTVAVGVLPEFNYREASLQMAAGDRLIVLSDGAFEVDTAEGQIGLEALGRYCAQHDVPLPQIFDWAVAQAGAREVQDDFTMLYFRF